MGDNLPLNDDYVFEKVREHLLDLMEEDPDAFQDLFRLSELASLPKRTQKLFLDLMAAVPFSMMVPKNVRKNDPNLFSEDHETVCNVRFLGDFGGIAVELEPTGTCKEPRVISITMLEMPLSHPLRKRVNEYRKKRVKKLRKQNTEY